MRGRLLPLTLAAALAGCAAPADRTGDLDAPIFGSAHPTTFVISPESGTVHARDLATVARVLRRYKTLSAAEQALVKSSVARRLNALVALEVHRLVQAQAPERRALQQLPDRALAARRLAALDAAVQQEAAERVAQRLGRLLAVPLKTSDNRSAVAYARVGTQGVEIARDADEIDRPIASLVEGEGVQRERNEIAKVVLTAPIAIASGP